MTTIGVLALQGDFIEHQAVLHNLDVGVRQVRASDELRSLDGLIIPGGESTTFCRLMQDFNLYGPLRALIEGGLPVWGTCAGLIVLARSAPGLDFPTLNALDITVRRNAYGRQVDSFEADLPVPALNSARSPRPFHGVFIRAPIVDDVGAAVDVLARLPADAVGAAGSPVALRQGTLLATTFHPELTDDDRFHRYFLKIVRQHGRRSDPK
ncbi:MAG TPA: pyridoxal 5'-phosphate synthase glutaminase subunit PdxT [Dehalococcoidia bacterium]|nr:pyridoxal 5'-phosphate synthase glutaminase subunit PdxT [Dehalococcoidia bacterium]